MYVYINLNQVHNLKGNSKTHMISNKTAILTGRSDQEETRHLLLTDAIVGSTLYSTVVLGSPQRVL